MYCVNVHCQQDCAPNTLKHGCCHEVLESGDGVVAANFYDDHEADESECDLAYSRNRPSLRAWYAWQRFEVKRGWRCASLPHDIHRFMQGAGCLHLRTTRQYYTSQRPFATVCAPAFHHQIHSQMPADEARNRTHGPIFRYLLLLVYAFSLQH